mmetsp:Transcript_20070/g.30767  ORF Transcript_20070/g.30767 Transcript_20070/m.30767 type:complete len:253 (-) Transcript_20070:39-797(-)
MILARAAAASKALVSTRSIIFSAFASRSASDKLFVAISVLPTARSICARRASSPVKFTLAGLPSETAPPPGSDDDDDNDASERFCNSFNEFCRIRVRSRCCCVDKTFAEAGPSPDVEKVSSRLASDLANRIISALLAFAFDSEPETLTLFLFKSISNSATSRFKRTNRCIGASETELTVDELVCVCWSSCRFGKTRLLKTSNAAMVSMFEVSMALSFLFLTLAVGFGNGGRPSLQNIAVSESIVVYCGRQWQ